MTLDDFFTLTEMNHGLTAPSRVRELMAVMQAEKDSVVKNIGDSTRQWSAVASAIAATENKECLDLFIQLDGLHFIDQWLKEAQKFSNDSGCSSVEESITHFLGALATLHVDHEKLVACEIWTTVKDLLIHRSSKVQDKARELFEGWQRKIDEHALLSDVEKVGVSVVEAGKTADIVRGSEVSESSLGNTFLSKEIRVDEKTQEAHNHDQVLSSSSNAVLCGGVDEANIPDNISEPPPGENIPLDHVAAYSSPKPSLEPSVCPTINSTSIESCNQAVIMEDACHGPSKFNELECLGVKPTLKNKNPPQKLVSLEASKMSEDENILSTSDAADEIKSATELSSTKESFPELQKWGVNGPDSLGIISDGIGSMDHHRYANQRRSPNVLYAKGSAEFNHHMLPKTSKDEKSSKNYNNLSTFLSGFGDARKVNKLELHAMGSDVSNKYNFSRNEIISKPVLTGKNSEVDLEDGIIDPLEFARQVAIEVEREVVDYREKSCSSSDKSPEGNTEMHVSPESISGKNTHASEGSLEEVTNDPDLSAENSPAVDESATNSEDQTNATQEMLISQVTETDKEIVNTEKDLCTFDLNVQICSEDADRTDNQFPVPVSVVSASRAAAAPGLPIAPLQFEGNLGWKGSAATSAFRPASPRRIPEGDKDLSTGGSSNSAKQRRVCLDFDLNMAETIDDVVGYVSPDKHFPLSCSLPAQESTLETNSRRSERLELDLNCVTEDGRISSDRVLGQFFPLANGNHNQSHSSSSKQASLKNLDLNDKPSFMNDTSGNSYLGTLSPNLNLYGAVKSDESVISIMGKRVEVKQKDNVSQSAPLPNGRIPERAYDLNLGRSGNFLGIGSVLPYPSPSSIIDFNNIASGATVPFSSGIYGSNRPFSYMVDSRGAPVVPQIVGSVSAPAFSQPPFFVNMTGSSPPFGIGLPQSSFDLIAGRTMENGNRDPAGFGQFLNSSQVMSVGEQLRSNSQNTTSFVVGGKRKEPDGGLENYPLKLYTPPWK